MILTLLLLALLPNLALVVGEDTTLVPLISSHYELNRPTTEQRDVLRDTLSVINLMKRGTFTNTLRHKGDVQWLKDFAPLLTPLYIMHDSYTTASIAKYPLSGILNCYRHMATFSLDPFNVRYDRPGLSKGFYARRTEHRKCITRIKRHYNAFTVVSDFADHHRAIRFLHINDRPSIPCRSHTVASAFHPRTLHSLSMALIILSRNFASSDHNSQTPFPSPQIRNHVVRYLLCMEDAYAYAALNPSQTPRFPKAPWYEMVDAIRVLIAETDTDRSDHSPLVDFDREHSGYTHFSPGDGVAFSHVLRDAKVDMEKWRCWFAFISTAVNTSVS